MSFDFSNAIYDSEHWFHISIPSGNPQFANPHTMHPTARSNCSVFIHSIPTILWGRSLILHPKKLRHRQALWFDQIHTTCTKQGRIWPRTLNCRILAPTMLFCLPGASVSSLQLCWKAGSGWQRNVVNGIWQNAPHSHHIASWDQHGNASWETAGSPGLGFKNKLQWPWQTPQQ